MNFATPALAILFLLLELVAFGAVVVAGAQAVARRFGERGLFVYWLASSGTLALLLAWWFVTEMPRVGRLWGVFLTPFLFLAITIGAVAIYLSRSRARRGGQFLIALAVFVAAVVPAAIVAQIPDLIYYNT